MILRKYNSDDYEKILELFYVTVHSVNSADYSEIQLDAWAPKDKTAYNLNNRLIEDYAIVAENNSVIVGFGNVNSIGYFDCLYVHKDYQEMGIATLIADNIEKYICNQGIQTITTDASITAKPFFEKRGYVVLKKQSVECRGQIFTNFKMKKTFN